MWKIEFKTGAVEDLRKIPQNIQAVIKRAVCERIAVNPYRFKPLKGKLKGYWRLRIGSYRVVYEIREKTVTVIIIKTGIRGNVYD